MRYISLQTLQLTAPFLQFLLVSAVNLLDNHTLNRLAFVGWDKHIYVLKINIYLPLPQTLPSQILLIESCLALPFTPSVHGIAKWAMQRL
ncbi:MAG: hypothetical protein IPH74_02850 [Bacteroidetes bacterium]|nr:hypothetical protein [Bacteroidota bacterium]